MGQQETRLRQALTGAALADVRTAANDWKNTALALDDVANKLAQCGPDVQEYFGGQTALAAQEPFKAVSANVTGRANEMRSGKGALDQAGFAMHDALQTRETLGAEPTDPGAAPRQTQGQEDADYLHHQAVHSRQVEGFNAAIDKREADSRRAADNMDRVYEQSTETMKKIHGEPDPVTQQPASSGGGGGGGGGGAGGAGGGNSATGGPSAPGHVGGPPQYTAPAGPGASGGQHTPGGSVSGGTGNPYPPSGPVIGSPQGPTSGSPTIPTPGAPTMGAPTTGAPGVSGPTAGGLAGALGGGMMGGMAGIGGAVRGPGTVIAPSGGSVGTGGRSIGTPGRSSGAARGGVLGRGGAAAGAGAGSPAGRSVGGARGAAGASGTRGTGRGAKAGSKGSAGNRSAGSGGTGGRGGRGGGGKNKSDKKGKGVGFFADEQDWVNDEGAAPGVIA